jgi:hypothetical protein
MLDQRRTSTNHGFRRFQSLIKAAQPDLNPLLYSISKPPADALSMSFGKLRPVHLGGQVSQPSWTNQSLTGSTIGDPRS